MRIKALLLILFFPVFLMAFMTKHTYAELDQYTVTFQAKHIPRINKNLEDLDPSLLANYGSYGDFKFKYGDGWSIFIDPTNGKPSYIGGQGIPMIPGKGNNLTMADLNLPARGPIKRPSLADVEMLIRTFIQENYNLFQLDDKDLTLMAGSGFYGENNYLCFLNFQISYEGIPIEGAVFQARLNHGNLVDMGITGHYIRPSIDPVPKVSKEQALDILGKHINGWQTNDIFPTPVTLKIIPYDLGETKPFAQRVGHKLVWEIRMVREGIPSLWLGWVDAHTGKVIRFEDITRYATYKRIHGKVYPEHIGGGSSLSDRSFPYAREDNQGIYASVGGLYPFPGGTATCTLVGKYANVQEQCSTQPNLSNTTGDLDFDGTTGQDCTYTSNANGRATEAALMGLYHVSNYKVLALTYLPSNTWLSESLGFRSNYNNQCNANWNGSVLTMYRSGSTGGEPCNNSGLLAGIFLHEAGHGLDDNDGSPNSTVGSSEIYGDTQAMILTHNSCGGDYFWASNRNCGPNEGYGNTCLDCGGVREADYNAKAFKTPSTPANWVCHTPDYTNGGYGCWSTTYDGPCGKEGHCEAAGMAETMWDLAVRDLPSVSGMGAATAWERFARLFFVSRPTSGDTYSCNCPDSDGCASDNWYRTFRVVDDDDGNLCNGTPNAGAIYAAFNRHAIACPPSGSCPNENVNSGTCPSIGAPNLGNPTAGPCEIDLSWSAVSNAVEYRVFRNEAGCDKGFILIGTVTTTSYIDTDVSPGVTYYYRVQGVGSNEACAGEMSTCKSKTPNDCTTCIIPDPPTGVACTGGSNQITVTWNNDGSGDGYRVYRQKEGTVEWVNVSGDLGPVTSFTDTNVLCSPNPGDVRYRYMVKSYEVTNGPCESSTGNVSGYCEASCGGCTPPSAPTGLTITDVCNQVVLSWTGVSGADGYTIYRKDGTCGGTYTQIDTVSGSDTTTYTDTTVTVGNTYAYVVRAYAGDTTCESGDSNCVSDTVLTTPSAPAAPTVTDDCSGLIVSWSPASGATSYNVYRRDNGCGNNGWSLIINGVTGTSWTDTGVTVGSTYGYYIEAVNSCGTATNGKNACGAGTHNLDVPGQPVITSITDNDDCAQDGIHINYTAGSGATSHDLYKDGALAVTGYVSGALYDPGDTATHTYVIRAINGTCTTDSASQNFADENNTPTPTISGPNSNTCPSESVTLTTEAGMSNYQWYLNGNPISGANSDTYVATQSGDYTVSYTNSFGCTGTSAPHSVTINPCIPNLLYTPGSFSFSQVEGDGDPNSMNPGEKWSLSFQVDNTTGTASAILPAYVTVTADNGLGTGDFCTNPVSIPDGANADGVLSIGETSGVMTVDFVIPASWGGLCPSDIQFGFISKVHNGGQPAGPDELPGTTEVKKTVGVQVVDTTVYNSTDTPVGPANPAISNIDTTGSPPPITTATVDWDVTSGNGDPTKIELYLDGPSGGTLTICDGNCTYTGTLDITSFYNTEGDGVYAFRGVHKASGNPSGRTVTINSWSITLQSNVYDCSAKANASCAATLPPVADGGMAGGTAATFTKSGTDITATWDNTSCSGVDTIILYGSIGDYTGYQGSVVCTDVGGDGTETFTPPAGSLWFNIVWTDGNATAGHPGYASGGVARSWSADTYCSITADDSSHTSCP